jgi:hypothetical protein
MTMTTTRRSILAGVKARAQIYYVFYFSVLATRTPI